MAAFRVFVFSVCFCVFSSLSHTAYAKIGKPVEITQENFEQIFEDKTEWVFMFYAPWCPACQHVKPVWLELAGWQDDLEVNVSQCDITRNPGLSGQFLIFGLPTIFHIKDGVTRQYAGTRDLKNFIAYLDDKKWEQTDPIVWYRDPRTFQMRMVGKFFLFANSIRGVHTTLAEDYGIPSMAVYVLFGIGTIVVGLIIGMLIVLLCDCLCPTRGLSPEDAKWLQKKEAEHDEEELREEDEHELIEEDSEEKKGESKKTN